MRAVLNACARVYKGADYAIDPRLPTSALLGVALRRGAAALRCVLRGIVFPPTPGRLIFVGPGVELRNRSLIRFGRGVTLGRDVLVDGLSVHGVSIGDRVSIGPYTIIEATGVVSDIGQGCTIGSDSGVGAFSFFGAAGGIEIGSNVIMGQRVSFHSENHNTDRTDIPIRRQGVTRAKIVIEDDCWVGANVTFLAGAHVGHGSVVAAGAVVRGRIPPWSVIGGVPAKVIRSRRSGDAP